MTEKAPVEVQTVGNMEVEAFFGLLLQMLEHRKTTGQASISDMKPKEFIEFMTEQLRTRSYAAAEEEASTAQRILTDWKGLQSVLAVANPFRVSSVEDVDRLAANLKENVGTCEFAVAVAIVERSSYKVVTPR